MNKKKERRSFANRKEKKLKVLITGGSGFIGKNLVECLSSDDKRHLYALFFPRHKDLELLDSRKVGNFVGDNKIELIIHCANIGGSRKTAYDTGSADIVYKNLRMFFNLAKHLGKARYMINFGSGAEYDRYHYQPRMKEDFFDRHIPEDAYAFAKYACSKYTENSGNIINLRLFGVFGRHEDYEYRFISNAIVKNLLGLPITINQNVYFDYIYADDLVRIVEYFMINNVRYEFYNVASGKSIDLITIANKINYITQKHSRIIIKNKGLNREYSADNSRLLKEIGNFSFTPFDEALRQLCRWYQGKVNSIDRKVIEKDEYIKYCRKC